MGTADIIDWSIALVPVLLLTAVFIWLDVFKLMSWWETLGLLLMGGVAAAAAYPLSGVFLDTLPIGFNLYSRFVAPWIEEALKAIVIISLFRFNRIGFKLDAVISGFAVGAGFSVVENILYLMRFADLPPAVWMVRGLGTAVMHGTTLAIMAAIAHELSERETRAAASEYDFNPLWFVPGLLAAIAIHTLFNQFPNQPMLAMLGTVIIAPLALMAIFRFGAGEAQQWLTVERDAHRAMLDTLSAGRFPGDPGGQRIAALAARSGAETGERIREYWEVLTRLVLTSEETLLQQSADADRVEADIGASFTRLAQLKRDLGRSTLTALTPLLPFSRNDYWELSELRERLKGTALPKT
ncbi:PrsW family glutamic-type intramembrane protease [Sphingomonas sp.]|uniref:PrsW family intramembrane metalloprotease n=1 Tax=Sphingomonas sp. TaxID=28214 RepID=UPI00286A8534|nr:PrsW family glutamic-type intramembrane protease [Sphingomonas sp.]